MTLRLYLSTRIGVGTRADPFRSKLANFIINDGTKDFSDWSNRATAFRFALAQCDSALHATIAADPDVVALSPELVDGPAVQTWLDGLVGTIPPAQTTALEAAGIPVDWVDGTTTRRQLWRFISAWHFMCQRMSGEGTTNALLFIASNLDSTVGSLTAPVRNQMSTWMSNHGLDTSWIVGGTLVRAVVKFAITNGAFPVMRIGTSLL